VPLHNLWGCGVAGALLCTDLTPKIHLQYTRLHLARRCCCIAASHPSLCQSVDITHRAPCTTHSGQAHLWRGGALCELQPAVPL
jgi:hypothetical protein